MKPKKDIFTLFRQSRHNLDESPSRQAWQKLERRLDGHRNRGSFQLYRSLAMVAAVVALVAVVFGITILLEQFEPKPDAIVEAAPLALEELSYSESGDDGFRTVVEFQKKYQSRFARPVSINEGSPDKRLVSIRLLSGNQYIAQADVLTTKKEAARGKVNVSPSKVGSAKPKSDVQMPEEEEVVSGGEKEMKNQGFAETKKRNKQAFNSPKKGVRNGTDLLVPEVAAFQWLIGQWKETLASGESYEEWAVKDEFSLQGHGYLLKDGKKPFSESMKIQKIGEDIFYILSLDASAKPLRFKLKTKTGQVAVFENEEATFSNQIILKTDGTKTEFTTIYQSKSSLEFPSSQLNYLRKRNHLMENNRKAIRTLSRVTAN